MRDHCRHQSLALPALLLAMAVIVVAAFWAYSQPVTFELGGLASGRIQVGNITLDHVEGTIRVTAPAYVVQNLIGGGLGSMGGVLK